MKKFILLMISMVICFQTILPTRGLENTDRVIEEQVVEEVVDNHIDETVEVNNLQSDVAGNVTYNIPFINKAELIQRIDSLENMMIFLGNTTNDQFRQLIDEFNNLYTDIDENVKKHIVMIQDNTLTVDEINKYIVDNSDYSIIQQALTEINNSTYGHNLILSIDSGSIVRVTDINSGKPEEYSWKDIANKELSINYPILIRQDNNISTFALNDNWSYKAKHGIQKFTAPISGKYLFNIWGADGDSDMGLKAVGVNEGLGHTTGIGGAAGYTSGIVHLDEGQVVYLSLGFRNNFSERRSYNGGGKGYGLSYGYRAGGGGAASVYLTQRGNGEIHNYQNNQEDIIMIAGGGGGAEDFYATGLQDFYCNTNACITSIGGAGGPNPNGGISTGPTGEGGKYLFGYGEDYASINNSSSGAGGGGLFGGTSANNPNNILKGGTGGGGLSYINEKLVQGGKMETKAPLNYYWHYDEYGWDDGDNAKATIELVEIDKFKLKINYIDINTNEQITDSYIGEIQQNDNYSVDSPDVPGFNLIDEKDNVITGVMPNHDIEINVYYDYSLLKINYLDFYTQKVLYNQFSKHIKTGTEYKQVSPEIENYDKFDDLHDIIQGIKKEFFEEFNVYYSPKTSPYKDIIEVNGYPVSKEVSDKLIQLKENDIVTYQITVENKRGVEVSKIIEDKLSLNNELVEVITKDYSYEFKDNKLKWDLKIPAQSTIKLQFKTRIKNIDNMNYVENWDRKDPYIKIDLFKDSDPKGNTQVGYNQEITYKLNVKNTGVNTINNIVVVDKIPANTEFIWINHDYGGKYCKDGNYVKFLVDEIKPDQIIVLEFKVRVTRKLENNETDVVKNVAYYQNYPDKQDVNNTDKDKNIFEKGNKTNTVTHDIVGVKLDIVKTADPKNNTIVTPGQKIKYDVKITNTGSVKANYIRVTDDIPTGTKYVDESLKLVSDNINSMNRYAFSHGELFDIHYDFNSKNYYLNNIGNITAQNGKNVKALQITWSNSLNLVSQTIPTSWSKYDLKGNTVYLLTNNDNSQEVIKTYLKSLRFSGNYGDDGEIIINAYDTAMICRFDEQGIVHFYEFVYDDRIPFTSAISKAKNRWFGGLQGYLATITSADEQNFLANSVATNSGWLGGTKIQAYGSSSGNWEWIDGPEKNKAFYTSTTKSNGGHALNGMYNFWESTQPDGYDHGDEFPEGCLQAFYMNGGWNDLTNVSFGCELLGYYVEYSDGYNGYYLDKSSFSTRLPKHSESSGCKYITNNGIPYVECITSDIEPNKSATMSFEVVIDNPINPSIKHIENVAKFEKHWNDIGFAGEIKDKPKNLTNIVIHPLDGKAPKITGFKISDPATGSKVDILDDITYKITVKNTGNAKANYVVVREYIPEYTTYKTGSISNKGAYVYNSKPYVEWVLKDVGVNESRTVLYTVDVDDNIPKDHRIIRKAQYELYYDNPGLPGTISKAPESYTNETIHTLLVHPGEKGCIDVTKSSNPEDGTSINRRDEIEYTLHVENKSSTITSRKILVRDYIPKGTTFKEILPYVSEVKDIQISHKYVDNEKPYVEWMITMLKAKESVDLKFSVIVDKEAVEDEIHNYASYGESEKIPSEQEKDDILKDKTNIVKHPVNNPEIKVIKKSNPVSESVVGRNREIEYKIEVYNISKTMANYVSVEDTLPEETELIDYSIDDNNDEVVDVNEGRTIRWLVKDLEPNEKRELTIRVKVKENVLDGTAIINKAYYEDSIKEPSPLESEEYVNPENPTNETVHYVEIGVDVLPTGGNGYTYAQRLISLLLIIVGLLVTKR